MAISSVAQGTIEADGKVFEFDSPKGLKWIESVTSFRFEPTGNGKPYTVRREASGYWYGCRKIAGKVRKKYIGKTSEVNTAKLEEIAEALELPPVPRVDKVVEVAEEVTQVAQDRFTALESEVADLRKMLETLQEKLLEKLELSDTEELPKVDSEVTGGLQNELSNLKGKNEKLTQELALTKRQYMELLENSAATIGNLQKELEEARAQLEIVQAENEALRTAQPVTEFKLPEPADLLNQLKAKRKKATASLADIEAILGILEM
jgi:chromosome segregation ATPase